MDLYDEFGNYIGPDTASEGEEPSAEVEEEYDEEMTDASAQQGSVVLREGRLFFVKEDPHPLETNFGNINSFLADYRKNQIVLHEDKKYYPSAEEVYGPGVEALVQEEDTQLLTQSVVDPIKVKKFFVAEENVPETVYNKE